MPGEAVHPSQITVWHAMCMYKWCSVCMVHGKKCVVNSKCTGSEGMVSAQALYAMPPYDEPSYASSRTAPSVRRCHTMAAWRTCYDVFAETRR